MRFKLQYISFTKWHCVSGSPCYEETLRSPPSSVQGEWRRLQTSIEKLWINGRNGSWSTFCFPVGLFLKNLNKKPNFHECQILLLFRKSVQHSCITDVIMYKIAYYTRPSFITWLSGRAQSGRSSFGRGVWLIESHIVLVIFFLLIDLFILDIKGALLSS
jgi:hypothetical protein